MGTHYIAMFYDVVHVLQKAPSHINSGMIAIYNKIENKILATATLAIVTLILCYQNLVFYINPNTSVLVFLLLIPFVLKIKKNDFSLRFGLGSLLFITLYFVFKMQLLFFLSFFSFLLFLIESNHGKVNALTIFIILLISPYANFIFNAFGFPIRLWLTEIASKGLSLFMTNVSSSGNNILLGDQTFSVDAECMGLTMVGYGYAITLLIINFFENQHQRKTSLLKVIGLLTTATIFIVLVNLFRIIFIVVVQAPPDTFLHETIGLLCFIVYLILPVFIICKFVVSRSKKTVSKTVQKKAISSPVKLVIVCVGILSMAFANHHREELRNKPFDVKAGETEIAGFDKSITGYNVIKFTSDSALVYIKPSTHFFAPDHSPTICWKGSGYEFIDVKTSSVNGTLVFTATLQKDHDELKTAWWFDNGNDKTISQLDWRWKSACGSEPFRLINVTSNSNSELVNQVSNILAMDLFTNP